jgi:hypothetical protein
VCPFQSLQPRVILQFQFLVGILMKEKMNQNVSAKCKNQTTYMWDTQFQYHTAHASSQPAKKVKGEFQTFLFIFGINHWLGYGIEGDKLRVHRQQSAMPFTSPQGQDRSLICVPMPLSGGLNMVYMLARQGYRHLLWQCF